MRKSTYRQKQIALYKEKNTRAGRLMNILFIHQNFPGQYKHLAPALAKAGHRCVALTLRGKEPQLWQGVHMVPYAVKRPQGKGVHPWLMDTETKNDPRRGLLAGGA